MTDGVGGYARLLAKPGVAALFASQLVVDAARGAIGLSLAAVTVTAGFPSTAVLVALSLTLGVGYLVRAAGFAGLAFARTVPLALLASFVLGTAIATVTVTLPSLLQMAGRAVGGTGRIFGLFGLANAGMIGPSALLYGAVASLVPLPTVFVVGLAGALALSLLAPVPLGDRMA